jgi:4-hydroxy-tetrahydrodipicolinate reductase
MTRMRLVVAGAAGRMGRMLVRTAHEHPDLEVVGAVEQPTSKELGADAGELAGVGRLGVAVSDDPLTALLNADGILDFTVPRATVALSEFAAQARVVHVIGTTGLTEADVAAIEAAARHAVVVRSGNMSLGVNLLAGLVARAASALGDDWDAEIVEMHHRMKVDAPSGTALLLGEAIAQARGIPLGEHSARARDGNVGARRRGDIGFASLRGGGVIGDHTVILAGPSERLEFTHRAEDRTVFARGAVRAALWGRDRKPGHYSMADVLGLAQN